MNDKVGNRPDRADAEEAVRMLLRWVGEDPERKGLKRTPTRVLNSFNDWFAGYTMDPAEILGTSFPEANGYDELVVLRDIDFESHCEHHMAPIIGRVHLAYLPGERVVGISKLVRVVEAYSKRLQVQEKLTTEIASVDPWPDAQPRVGVVVEAQHECMTTRGVRKTNIKMVTSCMLGALRDNETTRREFFKLIREG